MGLKIVPFFTAPIFFSSLWFKTKREYIPPYPTAFNIFMFMQLLGVSSVYYDIYIDYDR